MTGDSIGQMEDILHLDEQPYDRLRPVLCFDERPCQRFGDVLMPIPLQPGRAKRHDYAYARKGPWCIFLAFEPWRGWRFVHVRKQRTARDYAAFMQELVTMSSPAVDRMQRVQDN